MDKILKSLGPSFLHITEHGFVYGPQGKMLQRNIEKYWFLHCVTMPSYNIFLNGDYKTADNIMKLKEYGLDDMPFGLVDIEHCKNSENQCYLPVEHKALYNKIGKVSIFNDALFCKDLFFKKQKERNTWWRKLAREPSRFTLSEGKRTKSSEIVQIEANFHFGKVIVESISYRWDTRKLFSQVQLQNELGTDICDVHTIEHAISFDWGCAALLCDSIDGQISNKTYIHPKLAPYKVAFHAVDTNDTVNTSARDLNRLVLYLNNVLKTHGIDTILTNCEETLETYFVPFIVKTDSSSLKNGLIHVINNSTTLAETVHITDLTDYIASRCR